MNINLIRANLNSLKLIVNLNGDEISVLSAAYPDIEAKIYEIDNYKDEAELSRKISDDFLLVYMEKEAENNSK